MKSAWRKLERKNLKNFLNELSTSHELWLPYSENGKWRFVEYDPEKLIDLPTRFVSATVKHLFFPKRKKILGFKKHAGWEKPPSNESKPRAIMGIHACDVMALEYLDRVFIKSDYKDPYYEAERNRTLLIGITCDTMESMCHCTDRGTAPDNSEGMDIVLMTTTDGYLIRSVSERGGIVLDSNFLNDIKENPSKKDWPVGRYPLATPDEFIKHYSDDIWLEVSRFCLTCGICTFNCPTCSCFRIADETFKRNGERVSVWDSCQFRDYTRMAGGHNPRLRARERIKNRILDKFAYSFLRYGRISCTGCGRCILACPTKRNLPEIGAQVTKKIRQKDDK